MLVTLVDISCVCGFLYITRSVSLVVMRFLRNVVECHYARMWYLFGLLLFGGLPLIMYYITVSTVQLCHEGKILMITWFLSKFVHL